MTCSDPELKFSFNLDYFSDAKYFEIYFDIFESFTKIDLTQKCLEINLNDLNSKSICVHFSA